MASTIGGDDPLHDLTAAEKDKKERALREEARTAPRKTAQKLLNRATNISRRPSKKADHH